MLKNPLSIGSLLIILLGLTGVISICSQWKAYTKAKEIVFTIVEKPYDCDEIGRHGSMMQLRYQNTIWKKSISRGTCRTLDSDTITMLLSPDRHEVFFTDEVDEFPEQIAASCALSVVGAFCLYRSIKTKRKREI